MPKGRPKKSAPKKEIDRKEEALKSVSRGVLPDISNFSPDEVMGLLGDLLGGRLDDFMDTEPDKSDAPLTPRDEALDLIDQAMDATTPAQAEKLARQALRIDADCFPAYDILGEAAATPQQANEHYRRGLAISRRMLAQEGGPRVTPYLDYHVTMRTRFARHLMAIQDVDEAIAQYLEVLALDPEDRAGARHELLGPLMVLGRDREAAKLLDQYDDASALWAYGKALTSFRKLGGGGASDAILRQAVKDNKHVPGYLTGLTPMPQDLPGLYSPGSREEAIFVAALLLPAWKGTEGAAAWLRESAKLDARPASGRKAKPWKQLAKTLASLPQNKDARWYLAVRAINLTEGGDAGDDVWCVILADSQKHELFYHTAQEEEPTLIQLRQMLAAAMKNPQEGEPHRPGRILVNQPQLVTDLRDDLSAVGVGIDHQPNMPEVDLLVDQMSRGMKTMSQQRAGTVGAAELAALPQNPMEVWQVDERLLPIWMEIGGQTTRPRMALVLDADSLGILGMQTPDDGKPCDIAQFVAKAMAAPAMGEARRPGTVRVTSEALRDALTPHLEKISVNCERVDALPELDDAFRNLAEHMGGGASMASLLTVPGVTPAIAAGYFDAAAEFYRQRPWNRIPWSTIIRIESSAFTSGPWFVAVMGQSGIELGLAMYESEASLRELHAGKVSREKHLKRVSALHVSFGEKFEMAPDDVDAIEQHGWRVAGPEGFPVAMRVNPGPAIRTPLAWELRLLEAAMRGILHFVDAGARNPVETNVTTAEGPITVKLSSV